MTRSISGALCSALLLLMFSVMPASAHAELEESDPADGETIETPYTLTATFSEEFDPNPQRSFILVRDSAGDEVARGGVSAEDPQMMTVELPALDPGEYTVRWQTTTADDNGVERGTFTFNVVAATTLPPTSPPPTATPASPTARPTASAAPTATPAHSPTPSPSPIASPPPSDGPQSASGNDVLLALILGAVAIAAIATFLFSRSRR